MTLLETAKQVKCNTAYAGSSSDEMLELAVAFFNGEITYTQAMSALYSNSISRSGKAYIPLATALRKGILDGKVKLSLLS